MNPNESTSPSTMEFANRKSNKLITELPIYYGRVILLASVVGRVMTSPDQTYAFWIFIKRFIEDLGINRSMISTLYTIGTLTASLVLPLVGRLIDRRSPRIMVGIISTLFAAACFYMSFVQNGIMLGIGIMLLGFMLSVGVIFYRSIPEDYGFLPDGDKVPLRHSGSDPLEMPKVREESWTSAKPSALQFFGSLVWV